MSLTSLTGGTWQFGQEGGVGDVKDGLEGLVEEGGGVGVGLLLVGKRRGRKNSDIGGCWVLSPPSSSLRQANDDALGAVAQKARPFLRPPSQSGQNASWLYPIAHFHHIMPLPLHRGHFATSRPSHTTALVATCGCPSVWFLVFMRLLLRWCHPSRRSPQLGRRKSWPRERSAVSRARAWPAVRGFSFCCAVSCL